MRKAALAPALTLLLTLSTSSILTHGAAHAATTRDSSRDGIPFATDFIFPVGDPRISPNFDSTQPNGYRITQMFNNSCDPALGQGFLWGGQYFCGHTGVDLSDLGAGGPVHATAGGIVTYAGYYNGQGEMVRIKHYLPSGQVVYSQYEHMMWGSLQVYAGEIVAMGQTIGLVGATGFVTGAHLHFEIKSTDEAGVGYTFGNDALIVGYYEPISFVTAHNLQMIQPTATATATTAPVATTPAATAPSATTPSATASPSSQVLGLSANAPIASNTLARDGNEQQAVLADFYSHYHAWVVVTADHLNVRAGSGFEYTPLNSAVKGARLAYLGMTGNGWVHVALPSNVYGYVARQWVDGKMLPKLPPFDFNPKLKPPFAQVLDARYPARNGPMMHDAAIEVLKPGEKLTYLGTLGSWDKVGLPSGRIGWVLNWYLREPDVHINLAPASAPRGATSVTCPCVVTTVASLRLRAGPRLSAGVIEGLPMGTRLQLLGYHTSWVAVIAPGGVQGYVMATYVHTVGAISAPAHETPERTSPAPLAETDEPAATATATPSSADGTPTGSASADTSAGATATPAAPTVPPTPASGYVAPFVWVNVDHANLRAASNLKAAVFVSCSLDTKLAFLGSAGEWDHVETISGVIGWMKQDLVRTSETT